MATYGSSLVPTPNLESAASLSVSDLMDDHDIWCEEANTTHLTADDATLVREIQLSERPPKDVLYRWPTSGWNSFNEIRLWVG